MQAVLLARPEEEDAEEGSRTGKLYRVFRICVLCFFSGNPYVANLQKLASFLFQAVFRSGVRGSSIAGDSPHHGIMVERGRNIKSSSCVVVRTLPQDARAR